MKNHSLAPLLALWLALTTLLTACQRAAELPVMPAPKSWPVTLVEVAVGVLPDAGVVGSVVSGQRVEVTSRLSSYILNIQAQEGDHVRRGQMLVELDAADVEGPIRQATASVAAAQAASENAQTDLQRYQQLFARASVSDNEFRRVQLRADTAREVLAQAQAGRDMATAQRAYAPSGHARWQGQRLQHLPRVWPRRG